VGRTDDNGAHIAGRFYDSLMDDGRSLGEASMEARQTVMDASSDPTRLAYRHPSDTVQMAEP
jgi:hypothetical protein